MITVGLDEVGRGCWAGPLVAGAAILDQLSARALQSTGLQDSKRLTKRQRQRLAAEIRVQAVAVGLGWVTAAEIDEIGVTEAVRIAMQRALREIRQTKADYDEIIIDGNINFLPEEPNVKTIIKADASVPAVSAASIIAKVARDEYMANIAAQFPEYGFDQHVGYGTALHLQMLKLHGVCELHRRSFKPIRVLAP